MAKPPAFSQELREYFARFGRKGGKKAARNMTPEQRKANARKAARARWDRAKTKQSTPKS